MTAGLILRGRVLTMDDGCVLPGFVEAHGHFPGDATAQSPALVDIRPVVLPAADEVLAAIRKAVATRPVTVCNGWEPLLQKGLPEPILSWLDGLTPTTPDPPGGRFARDAAGRPAGAAYGPAAISMVTRHLRDGVTDAAPALLAESARVNARGVTMMGEMAFDPGARPLLLPTTSTTGARCWTNGSARTSPDGGRRSAPP